MALQGNAARDDARVAVDADPPEGGPVVGVVVGEQRDPWVLLDVAQPPEVRRRLRLVVHRGADQVPVHGERDGH